MKLKILMLNTTDVGGGAATACFALGDALKRAGHDVKYLVGYKYSKRKDVSTLNFPTSNIPKQWVNTLVLYARHFRSYLLADDISYGDETSFLNHPWVKQADLIHLHNRHGNFISLKAIDRLSKTKKVIWTLHDVWALTQKSAIVTSPNLSAEKLFAYPPMLFWPKSQLTAYKRQVLKNKNINLVAPSLWLSQQTQNILNRPASFIPHGLAPGRPDPDSVAKLKQSLHLKPGRPVAVFVALDQNARDKGLTEFSQLAQKHHSSHDFVWIGTKTTQPSHLKTLPYQSNPQAFINALAIADVLIAPSKAEVFGLVVLQALQMGIPVLAYSVGGVTELIKHQQSGYLAKNGDIVDLEKGFKFVGAKLQSIDQRLISRLQTKYSLSKMVTAYEKLYDSLN